MSKSPRASVRTKVPGHTAGLLTAAVLAALPLIVACGAASPSQPATASYPTSDCKPVTAHWLRVYPPGETAAGYVGHTFSACASTSVSLLSVLPVRADRAVVGVAS